MLRHTEHDVFGMLGASPTAYLVGVHADAYPLPLQQPSGASPKNDTTFGEFAAANPTIDSQLWNRSKKCPACGKVCAVTLHACNMCEASLEHVNESATENVPMGFVYGVARASKFPLLLSLRYEDAATIVYDDPLARSTCHMNAVPTDVHLPDWRWLLTRPEAALELLARLEAAAWRAVESIYASTWRDTVLRPGSVGFAEELRPHVILAFNAVVSQYQLHMHVIVPPFTPQTFHGHLRGERFQMGRWLPIDFLRGALEVLRASEPIANAPSRPHADLLDEIASRGGPQYAEAHANAMAGYTRSHEILANWQSAHFAGVTHVDAQGGTSVVAPEGTPLELRLLAADDKRRLASYGWPLQVADGKPAPASYYSHAKDVDQVMTADEWRAGGARDREEAKSCCNKAD